MRAAQKVVLEARRSIAKGWHSGSLASTPFSSLTQNVCIPSRAGKPGLDSLSLTNGSVSSASSRKHHKLVSNSFQGGSSSQPPRPNLVNGSTVKPKPKVLNIPQTPRTERPNGKQGSSFPIRDTASSPSRKILCSAPTLSRSVKTEAVASTSSPTTPVAATATQKDLPVQPSFSTKVKSTKARPARDCSVKQAKTSKPPLPLKIEQ